MRLTTIRSAALSVAFAALAVSNAPVLQAADKELLDILLENGVITQEQHGRLLQKESVSSQDILMSAAASPTEPVKIEDLGASGLPVQTEAAIQAAVAQELEQNTPVIAEHGSKGFKFATRDGNWETNLQWRGQFRYTNPTRTDPRQLDDFEKDSVSNFEARRLRMKIGGHGYKPWLKYYFEVDLQPGKDVDSNDKEGGARVIDWRVDIAKYEALGIRLGQWKVDLNRERVDSSGRQQFVERSIVNRIFTIDRQVGVQLRGRLFKETPADLRYWAGVFNGTGKGAFNEGEEHLLMGRLQWNFMGRDLSWRQTDVEFTEKPTGSLAFAYAASDGPCTRFSSSGCGRLDGFLPPALAGDDQYSTDQYVQEFAFKYRGLSIQQEYHRKTIDDNVEGITNKLTGFYAQSGYFFHHLIPAVPPQLELAARYAFVEEPNETNRLFDNEREEFTLAANWFIAGHNNKITLDYSYLTLDDGLAGRDDALNRVRLQWDVSF